MFKQNGIWAEYLKTKTAKSEKHTRKITNKKHSVKKTKTAAKGKKKSAPKVEVKVEETK
jgi:hypothetical protein